MTPIFHNNALFHNQNSAAVLDRTQPMGDHYHGAVTTNGGHVPLDNFFKVYMDTHFYFLQD